VRVRVSARSTPSPVSCGESPCDRVDHRPLLRCNVATLCISMVLTRSRLILVTAGGAVVTIVLEAVALTLYIALFLHENLVLSNFAPWLVTPALILAVMIGCLGDAIAGVSAWVGVRSRSHKTILLQSPPPSTSTTSAQPAPFPAKVSEINEMRFYEPYHLPTEGPYLILSVDQARDIEAMVNDMKSEVAHLKERLAIADELLGQRTREAFVDKLATERSTTPSTTTQAVMKSKNGFPMVNCERCGKAFEQTIPGRTKCPDCWSLEEYLLKPSSPQPASVPLSPPRTTPVVTASMQPQPVTVDVDRPAVDHLSEAIKRLSRSPALLATLRFVSEHPGVRVVDIAAKMQRSRGPVSGSINDLNILGLFESLS